MWAWPGQWEDGLGLDEGPMEYGQFFGWCKRQVMVNALLNAQCTMHNAECTINNAHIATHKAQCTQLKNAVTLHLNATMECNIEQAMTEHANATIDATTHAMPCSCIFCE